MKKLIVICAIFTMAIATKNVYGQGCNITSDHGYTSLVFMGGAYHFVRQVSALCNGRDAIITFTGWIVNPDEFDPFANLWETTIEYL